MEEITFLIEQCDDGGYTAKALGASIVTEGDTLEDLKNNIADAVQCHFDDEERPKLIRIQ